MSIAARRYSVRGQVQGVGFRDFAQREARLRKLTGYVRNVADGSVLVCAVGSEKALGEMEAALRRGPRWSEVREVSVEEMQARPFDDFRIVP